MRTTRAAMLAGLGLLVCSGRAFALDADTFAPSGSTFDGQGTVNVTHPSLWFPGAWYGGVALYWADDPVVRSITQGTDTTEEVVVDGMFGTQLAGGYTIKGVARIDLAIPTYPYVGMGDTTLSGGALGDIRLGGVIPILKPENSPLGLSFVPTFRLPTGKDENFTGNPGLGVDLAAAVGGFINTVGWAVNAGFGLGRQETVEDLSVGSAMNLKGGLFVPIGDSLKVGGELESKVSLTDGTSYNENPMEGHLFGQYGKQDGLVVTTGLGTGLVAGVGAPDIRLFLAVGYHNIGTPPVYDIDLDGIPDASDRCPSDPEDRDNFEDIDGCPDLDNDTDGIADARDQCPLQPEDFDTFKDEDGCPDPDNDGDRVLDTEDKCPNDPGTIKTFGCPDRDGDFVMDKDDKCIDVPGPIDTAGCPDRDGDKVPDFRDKCPDEACDKRVDPERSDGCPAKVFVSKEKIEILDKIYFDTNKTTIQAKSNALLTEIAKVLNDNKDIALIEVAGHTDDKGDDAANMKLSQGRSDAVVKWLVDKGQVNPARLVAMGYGETKPIDTNTTDAGRANNRRVEFVILKQ